MSKTRKEVGWILFYGSCIYPIGILYFMYLIFFGSPSEANVVGKFIWLNHHNGALIYEFLNEKSKILAYLTAAKALSLLMTPYILIFALKNFNSSWNSNWKSVEDYGNTSFIVITYPVFYEIIRLNFGGELVMHSVISLLLIYVLWPYLPINKNSKHAILKP